MARALTSGAGAGSAIALLLHAFDRADRDHRYLLERCLQGAGDWQLDWFSLIFGFIAGCLIYPFVEGILNQIARAKFSHLAQQLICKLSRRFAIQISNLRLMRVASTIRAAQHHIVWPGNKHIHMSLGPPQQVGRTLDCTPITYGFRVRQHAWEEWRKVAGSFRQSTVRMPGRPSWHICACLWPFPSSAFWGNLVLSNIAPSQSPSSTVNLPRMPLDPLPFPTASLRPLGALVHHEAHHQVRHEVCWALAPPLWDPFPQQCLHHIVVRSIFSAAPFLDRWKFSGWRTDLPEADASGSLFAGPGPRCLSCPSPSPSPETCLWSGPSPLTKLGFWALAWTPFFSTCGFSASLLTLLGQALPMQPKSESGNWPGSQASQTGGLL